MIIVPDIHGRSFWQEAIKRYPEEKVIFLGDYLDPYAYEGLGYADGLEQLFKVIELKKQRPNQVTLLLGNHDIAYLYPREETPSRHDFNHEDEVGRLLQVHLHLFDITHLGQIQGKNYLFSHAGLLPGWVTAHENLFGEFTSLENAANQCNGLLHAGGQEFQDALNDISRLRLGDKAYGSVLWADEYEMERADFPQNIYQIFGHTQQESSAIITNRFACLDCRMAFRLDEETGFISAIEQQTPHQSYDWDEIEGTFADITLEKAIFLDFDGVMHTIYHDSEMLKLNYPACDDYGPVFDPVCIDSLAKVVEKTGAKIIISSSWKESMDMDEIQQMWIDRQLPGQVIDVTPCTGGDRGDEIKAWLNLHPRFYRYVILDDMDGSCFLKEQIPNFVLVNPWDGLNEETSDRAITILMKE